MTELHKRILEVSYENRLSHIGSNLGAVDIIETIYDTKKPDEKFVLSSGHAGLALYVVLEARGLLHDDINTLDVHPVRSAKNHIEVSTGSLGQGLPIAVGMAMADRSKDVYCLISDGECAEGSIWEALAVIEDNEVDNFKLYVNMNGWGAYRKIDRLKLASRIKSYVPDATVVMTDTDLPFAEGLAVHYHVMSEEDYGRTTD